MSKDKVYFEDIVSQDQLKILIQINTDPNRKIEEKILEEMVRDDSMHEVQLEQDIYCIGFITFLKSESPKKLDRIVLKCIWTFIIQISLLCLLVYAFGTERTKEGTKLKEEGIFKDIVVGDPTLNMSRMICAFLLHVTIIPEIKSAKDMLSFAKKNPSKFSGQRFEYPMIFATFKLLGGMFCFFCNMLLCLISDNSIDVVKDFVAVQIISCVDDLMVGAVTADDAVDKMRLYVSNERLSRSDYEIWQTFIMGDDGAEACEKSAKEDGQYRRPLSHFQKLILACNLVVYRSISIVYHIAYFYFAPFTVAACLLFKGAESAEV